MKRILCAWAPAVLLALVIIISGCRGGDDRLSDYEVPEEEPQIVPAVNNLAPPWPEWILGQWVWEDESTRESAESLVDGYLGNDIPVSAIILDSPWETGYNTFEFDQGLYPDAAGMIDRFHGLNVRVFCWITSVINIDSPNYLEAFNNGYFINNAKTLKWWKGTGSYIDYNNPMALQWWHEQMDKVLNLGIDGWKTDMTASLLKRWIVLDTYTGMMTWSEYQEVYYRDFFNYTRQRLGDDRVITARPVDSFGNPQWGDEFAPRDVNFAGWVGDQGPDWQGLRDALINLELSAKAGYVNIGSDIGGYHGGDVREKELFIRWAQLGALSPIMENGGNGEHRPWMYDSVVLDTYRRFAKLHQSLIPYLYSMGAAAYAAGESLMHFLPEGKWHYLLGDDILVAPVVEPVDHQAVIFPAGGWFDLEDNLRHQGPVTLDLLTPLESYPVFFREGAIIPMLIEDSVFGDDTEDQSPLTVTVYLKPDSLKTFDLYEQEGPGARIEVETCLETTLSVSATDRAVGFRVLNLEKPGSVSVNPTGRLHQAQSLEALKILGSGYIYFEDEGELWIKPGLAERGLIVTIN